MRDAIASEAAKAAPPITVTVAWMADFPINFWVGVATISYIVLQAAFLIWKWHKEYKQ